jgi:hypothetical protein
MQHGPREGAEGRTSDSARPTILPFISKTTGRAAPRLRGSYNDDSQIGNDTWAASNKCS